jgi:AraC-like DNA-binding protein
LASLLVHLKLDKCLQCPATPSWRSQLASLLQTDNAKEWKLEEVCQTLATSESKLRRKLQQEGTGFREVLEDLRLTNGLGMLQTTAMPITQIALECGYQSASRFSERFKKRFQTTPRDLRQAL